MGQRTGSMNHTHRYILKQMGSSSINPVWKCSLPGCAHFIPRNVEVWGRMSICWNCGKEFPMDESNAQKYILNDNMPNCESCIDLAERGEVYIPPAPAKTVYDVFPSAPRTSTETEEDAEKKRLKEQLKKRIEIYKSMGLNTKELEEELNK